MALGRNPRLRGEYSCSRPVKRQSSRRDAPLQLKCEKSALSELKKRQQYENRRERKRKAPARKKMLRKLSEERRATM